MRSISAVLIALVVSACSTDIDTPRCEDPKYGDGTCDAVTSCEAPDIDCYQTFDTPEAAKSWYDGSPFVPSKGMSAPVSDARYAHMQELIDEGWEAYKRIHDVGDLASKRVQLVLIDSTVGNAFAAYDPTAAKVSLAVMVNKGLIDLGGTDDQLIGVVMHELEHALGLHVLPGNAARIQKFYVVDGAEPLGFELPDNATVRALFQEWEAYSDEVGYMNDAGLVGFPLILPEEYRGAVVDAMLKLIIERATAQPAACSASVTAYDNLSDGVMANIDPLTDGANFTAAAPMLFQDATVKVANECFGTGFPGDAITHIARLRGLNEAELRAAMPADLKALIEGRHAIVGFYNWIQTQRTKMHDVEVKFMAMTGKPFSALRYFSTEEAADDSSVRSLIEMGLDGDGTAQMLLKIYTKVEPRCTPLLAAGSPVAYGDNLRDSHHNTCWRASHSRAMVKAIESGARIVAPQPIDPVVPPRRSLFYSRNTDVMD